MIFSKITNTKIKAKDKSKAMAYGNYKSLFVNFPNIRILLSSDLANALAILIRSSLSVLSLWKSRMDTELKRVGSIVDCI